MSVENAVTINKNQGYKRWWFMLRPHTLTASFVPVILGSVLALPLHQFHIFLFIAMLIASMFIQIATNLFNEYFDFKRGLDTKESIGIGGTIVRDGVNPKTVLNLAYGFLAAATLIGLYICVESTWWLAVVGIICMMAGYFYSGGPYPIAYTPLGELVSGLFMGVFIILISFYIQTHALNWMSVFISIPIGILIGSINMSNNIRDLEGDKAKGRKTLPILLGKKKAVQMLSACFISAYLCIALFVLFQIETFWILLTLVSIPKAIKAIKGFIGKSNPIEMMPAMKATAQTTTLFGLLLSLGLVIGYFF